MNALGRRSMSSILTVVFTVCWYGLAVVLALVVVIAIAAAFGHLGGGELDIPVSFSVDGAAVGLRAPTLAVDAARIQGARGSLIFTPSSNVSLVAPFLTAAAMLVVALLVLGRLLAVLRTLRDGHPFVPANARRIRWIGWAVIAAELARATVTYSANGFAGQYFSADGLVFDARPDLDVLTIVAGLIILVIAEVFRLGAELDQEQSLTV